MAAVIEVCGEKLVLSRRKYKKNKSKNNNRNKL
jgi:hypothetical protein